MIRIDYKDGSHRAFICNSATGRGRPTHLYVYGDYVDEVLAVRGSNDGVSYHRDGLHNLRATANQ